MQNYLQDKIYNDYYISRFCLDTVGKWRFAFILWKCLNLNRHKIKICTDCVQLTTEDDAQIKNMYLTLIFIYLALVEGQGHHNSAGQLLWAQIT